MTDPAIESIARLFCEYDEFKPDDQIPTTGIEGDQRTYPRWWEYRDLAEKAYYLAKGVE